MNLEDLSREVMALKARVRLTTLSFLGALVIAVMAGGGADAVARTLVEPDAWKISTKRVNGTTADRLFVTSDIDIARIRLAESRLQLASEATLSTVGVTAGTLGYDS